MEADIKNNNLKPRPPIVVVLGHVDHGKTSLLDAIRSTNIVSREAGGITQKIGSSVVTTKDGKKITFIDTPGHAAFSAMRGRGAKVADIALLIVASDDGIKPQTKEAIAHIRQAGIPFIVTLTKADLLTSDSEKVRGQIESEGILLEKRGGNTPWIEVSVKDKRGMEELLETISLISEVNDISADVSAPLEAVVIESAKDKAGPVANVVVRNGTISVGDTVYVGTLSSKVRNLIGDTGPVKSVTPGEPCQIIGFEEVPSVGSLITSIPEDEKLTNSEYLTAGKLGEEEIGVYIKASNQGTLEAVSGNLPQKAVLLGSGIGDVNEGDIMNAKSLGAVGIFVFESKVPASVGKLAEAEGVSIYTFRIIYELFDKLSEIIEKGRIVVFGKAEIKAKFPFNNKQVAGCKVITGKISKKTSLHLMRGDKELGKIKALSIKKAKSEVEEVSQGEEFGMLFAPQLDFTIGDVIIALK